MAMLAKAVDLSLALVVTVLRAVIISFAVVVFCVSMQHVILPYLLESDAPPLSPPLRFLKGELSSVQESLLQWKGCFAGLVETSLSWSWLLLAVGGALLLANLLHFVYSMVWRPWRVMRFLKQQGVPGPPYQPLIGSMLMYRASIKKREQDLEEAKKIAPISGHYVATYGPVYVSCFGPRPALTIADPVLVKQVLVTSASAYHKTDGVKKVLKFLGNGLVTADGDSWAWQRKMINPSFSHKHLKKYLQVMTRCTQDAVERWADSAAGEGGPQEVELHQEIAHIALDIIGLAAFGAHIGGSSSSARVIYTAFERLTHHMQRNSFSFLNFVPFGRWLPSQHRSMIQAEEKRLRGLALKLVQQRRAAESAGAADSAEKDDLLAVIMREKDANTKQGMTDEQLVDECMTFLLAGHETTTQLVSWTMMLLAQHPSYTAKVREEVLLVLGPTRAPDHDDISKLKFLNSLIYESLRLYPPVCFVSRQAVADTEVGSFKIPKGMEVLVAIYQMHTRKDIWGEDALEFRPERFANGIAGACKHPMAFLPFGGGPRTCIGQNFAIMEAKVILSMILQRFDFRLAPTFREANDLMITLRPRFGLQMILERRPGIVVPNGQEAVSQAEGS